MFDLFSLLHFSENQMFRCKIWNKGVFARKSGSAEQRLRWKGGSALAEVQSGQEWLHCWTQTILLTECCNMVVQSGSPTGTNEGWGTSITTKNVVLTLESMFEEGILSVSATRTENIILRLQNN